MDPLATSSRLPRGSYCRAHLHALHQVPLTRSLHAIIVTFRRPEPLAETIAALRSQTRPPDSITVVDNDADPEVERLAARLGVRYQARPTNEGPAGAVLAGVASVRTWAPPADLVMLSDDDNPPTGPRVLEHLMEAWETARREGMNPGGIGASGGRYRRRTGTTQRPADDELTGWIRVDSLAGGIQPTYSLEALAVAGSTRPELFFGYEELELGLRLRAAGYDLLVPGAVLLESRTNLGRLGMTARTASAVRVRSPWRAYYSARNLLWVARRHGAHGAAVLVSGREIISAARDLVRFRDRRSAILRLRGVADGWRGRLGRVVEPG